MRKRGSFSIGLIAAGRSDQNLRFLRVYRFSRQKPPAAQARLESQKSRHSAFTKSSTNRPLDKIKKKCYN